MIRILELQEQWNMTLDLQGQWNITLYCTAGTGKHLHQNCWNYVIYIYITIELREVYNVTPGLWNSEMFYQNCRNYETWYENSGAILLQLRRQWNVAPELRNPGYFLITHYKLTHNWEDYAMLRQDGEDHILLHQNWGNYENGRDYMCNVTPEP